jgi:hypothetical protein
MPTKKERIQVLLTVEDAVSLQLLRKDEERSAAFMGAQLIKEALVIRKSKGWMPESHPNYEAVKQAIIERCETRSINKGSAEGKAVWINDGSLLESIHCPVN